MELYQLIIFCLLSWMALGTLLNLLVFPTVRRSGKDEERREDANAALVSVMIPARNEERNIGILLDSLKAQNDPNFEVLVMDDRSDDGTLREILARGLQEGAAHPEAQWRYYDGVELPAGWAGKPWACHQLVQHAKGKWLLFTDADTRHGAESIRAAVETAMREDAGLLSAWPRQITGTWAEKLVIPLLYILTHTLLPQALVRALTRWPWLARLAGPKGLASLGAANGQFLLFRRDVYALIGGHFCVKNHLVEDVQLGREVLKRAPQGVRLVNADGAPVVECRMYNGFSEVWEGFSKNLRPVFGTNLFGFLASGVVQVALFIAPFVFAVMPMAGQHWALGQVGVLLLIRAMLMLRFRTSWLSLVLHPLAYLLALSIAINSWRWALKGKIRWKGREYAA